MRELISRYVYHLENTPHSSLEIGRASVQFSSVPGQIKPSGSYSCHVHVGHEGRCSRDPLPVFSAGAIVSSSGIGMTYYWRNFDRLGEESNPRIISDTSGYLTRSECSG